MHPLQGLGSFDLFSSIDFYPISEFIWSDLQWHSGARHLLQLEGKQDQLQ